MTNFAAFFESLWRSETWPKPEPFPWQVMLAGRGTRGAWPEAINLPTASGKTACLDAAVFALAATAAAPSMEARMPRRIWFVVDRRVVVDEAFSRAKRIAASLAKANAGPLKEVADRLRALSGTGQPLAVARLRGGAWRDDGWARIPSQPAIICSTVDQAGSALLFRAYGHSDRAASIYAGLAAHDSLILLDEAHCAVPFLQTVRAVARFRAEPWADQSLKTPFLFSVMSATPPADIAEEAAFPGPSERAAALDHAVLQQRLTARKIAALAKPVNGDEAFLQEAADRALEFSVKRGKRRVAVMVNRVATAERIAERLAKNPAGSVQVVLLTGRMRPMDRDALVERWEPVLKAGSAEPPAKPVIVVTTQCLEVGADFSFDALVTECASLDALRQRFGRLDRLGDQRDSQACLLIREQQAKPLKNQEADPIYGTAIRETWTWLNEPEQSGASGSVDFGIQSMDSLVNALREADPERFDRLLAPATDAPVLLPAHLDLLCQTSPRPSPQPDVTLFLHGKERGAPDARVLLRADLPDPDNAPDWETTWLDVLSLAPPASPEMLTVPLYRLRRWLAEGEPDELSGDVEGGRDTEETTRTSRRPFVVWRGAGRAQGKNDPARILPNDVVVLKAGSDGLRGLGQPIAEPDGAGAGQFDLAERSLLQARGVVVLRVHKDVLAPWAGDPGIAGLLDVASEPEAGHDEVEAALHAILSDNPEAADAGGVASPAPLPSWLRSQIQLLAADGFRIQEHPAGGVVLTGKKRYQPDETELEDDPLADEEDLRSSAAQAVTLRQHSARLYSVCGELAARCLDPAFGEAFGAAAKAHDLGKLDPRFQLMLRNGFEDALDSEPLAKSEWLPERRRRRTEIRADLALPEHFRHELFSMQLAEQFGLTPGGDDTRDLTLHLIASHHGYARPFAPVAPDPLVQKARIPGVSLACLDLGVSLAAEERAELPPPHRLDSGVAERYWRLVRRYGWWGLAYLEAIFRLADWEASRNPKASAEARALVCSPPGPRPRPCETALDALDGANPLAYLAALGTLRLLSRAFPGHEPRMSWSPRLGAWRPSIRTARPLPRTDMLQALLDGGLKLEEMFSAELLAATVAASPMNKKGEPSWKDKLMFPVPALREFCAAASARPSVSAEFSAAWAGETAPTGEDEKQVARRTRFDFTAGQQAFIKMLRELRGNCTPADLERTLFTGWRYSASAVSLRWDPQDEKRQYALQAVDPTNGAENPSVADAGANFLAVEALPLFPLVPDRWASQPGFSRGADGRFWRWPVWTHSLTVDAVRSLLFLRWDDADEWSPARREAAGVPAVFQSSIVQPSGRYRCFTPARSL